MAARRPAVPPLGNPVDTHRQRRPHSARCIPKHVHVPLFSEEPKFSALHPRAPSCRVGLSGTPRPAPPPLRAVVEKKMSSALRERMKSPIRFEKPSPAITSVGDGKHLHAMVDMWLKKIDLDSFLKYRPLKYDLCFNESLRSIDEQTGNDRVDSCPDSYHGRIKENAITEIHTQRRRTAFFVKQLQGAEANRFRLLEERNRLKGFPIPNSLSQERHGEVRSYHNAVIIFAAPRTPGIRCMVVGKLTHLLAKKLRCSAVQLPETLTTMTRKLVVREHRTRADINPAASLRLLQRMQAQLEEQKLMNATLTADGDLHEALSTVLDVVRHVDNPNDEEEAERIKSVLRFALAGDTLKSHTLPFEIQETMIRKAVREAAPLRGEPEGPAPTDCPENFAHYNDCYLNPSYLVIYRSNRIADEEAVVPSIVQRRHEGSAEAAAAGRDPNLSLLEFTMQWHCPIADLGNELQDATTVQKVTVLTKPFSNEVTSQSYPLTNLLRLFGNGVTTIDISSTGQSSGPVEYRHSFYFSNK